LELGDIEDLGAASSGNSSGLCSEHAVRCPWHGRLYDLRTGHELHANIAVARESCGINRGQPVQRPHDVETRSEGLYVRLMDGSMKFPSDEFAFSDAVQESRPAAPGKRKPRNTLELFLGMDAAADDTKWW